MPTLLDCMPFSHDFCDVAVRGERVKVRANQIIVWLTLSHQRSVTANPMAIPFPAILDTGHNHSFSLNERHLVEWAGLRPDNLNSFTTIRHRGQRISLRAANLWIHPNERGLRERNADRLPHPLKTKSGIAVYPGHDFPRLPILGLRAIAENNLILKVDGPKRQATLRTPHKWWPFAS